MGAPEPFHVLVVEDDPEDVARIHGLLCDAELGEFRLTRVVRLSDARARLREGGSGWGGFFRMC